MPAPINIIGQRFGRLVVLEYRGSDRGNTPFWLCQCDCGEQTVTRGNSLRSGGAKSCGCWYREAIGHRARTHGHYTTRTYSSWVNMIQRCTNPKSTGYKNWGGRGITVCERWRSFVNFLADMGERPLKTSLDRRENDKGYFKENCRWATPKEQLENRRPRQRQRTL
jgi:hypothetical protein